VRTDRIREIAGLRTGRVFDPDNLEAVTRRLRNTGAFRSVAIEEAETPNPDGSLDIALNVVEDKPRRFGFGAELSSFEGISLNAYWMHRNLLGGAERLRFDAEIEGIGGESGEDYTLAASFQRPGTFDAANTLYARAEIAQLDEPDYFERLGQIELGLTREISARTRFSFGIPYQFADVSDDLGDRQFSLIALPATAEHDRRNNPLNATQGFFLKADATPFQEFNSGATGLRLEGDARYYRGFGAQDRVTLAGRLLVGSVIGAGLTETPPDMLFYSGGGGTVRGQPYRSLSVPLGGGDSIGGRNLLVASAEVRFKATEKFAVVGFADWGFVGSGSVPGTDGASHAGAGLGLRYDTTIGPIRLDGAAPVSGPTSEGVQVYIGIGPAF
jgi:translocation and assembly module TamA